MLNVKCMLIGNIMCQVCVVLFHVWRSLSTKKSTREGDVEKMNIQLRDTTREIVGREYNHIRYSYKAEHA